MNKSKNIKMKGKVIKAYSSQDFDVKLENGLVVKGILSGKMLIHRIKVLPGDDVDVELSPYDLTKCRIKFRR